MRWPWCERRTRSEERGSAGAGVPLARSVLLVAVLGACITATTREFTLAPGGQRLAPQDVRAQGDAVVRAECPRLLRGESSATGAAEIRLTVNRSGAVTTARVERGTGDQRMDEMFGTLAAGLQFDPPEGMTGETVTARAEMGYSCSPSVNVLTFRLRQPEESGLTPLPDGAME